MIKTRERGKAVSINDQSAAAGATIPISLVVTSAIKDQAYGAPRHICVVKAGITISHLLVNVGDATFDSGPNSLAKRLFGSAATGLVASLEVSVLVENWSNWLSALQLEDNLNFLAVDLNDCTRKNDMMQWCSTGFSLKRRWCLDPLHLAVNETCTKLMTNGTWCSPSISWSFVGAIIEDASTTLFYKPRSFKI